MYRKIVEKIKEYETIIIHRHSKPDGDAMGSQIGLREAIKETFPKKKVYVVGDTTDRYNFIGKMDEIEDSLYDNALVFVLDSSEEKLISDERYKKAKYIIKIDHHLFKESYGNYSVVDNSEGSCAAMIARLVFSNGLKLTKIGAEALYTGIVTDSGRFRYVNDNMKGTFDICSKLFKYDIDVSNIYNQLYLEDLDMVKLRAKMILAFKTSDKGVAYLINTKEDVKEYNMPIANISRGMVNIMGGIKGIDIWANFTETECDGVIVELRSSKYNINTVAVKYGGGGHKLASGMTLKDLNAIKDVIKDLEALMEDNNG